MRTGNNCLFDISAVASFCSVRPIPHSSSSLPLVNEQFRVHKGAKVTNSGCVLRYPNVTWERPTPDGTKIIEKCETLYQSH